MVTMRARSAGSIGSAKVSVIASTRSRPSASLAGMALEGAAMRVVSRAFVSRAAHAKRASGGHGSAGRNWRVRASSQVNAPGCGGESVTRRSG